VALLKKDFCATWDSSREKKNHHKKTNRELSLHPLGFREAVSDLLKVKLERRQKRKKATESIGPLMAFATMIQFFEVLKNCVYRFIQSADKFLGVRFAACSFETIKSCSGIL